MTAEELGRALIHRTKQGPLAAGEGSAMIAAAIEQEERLKEYMELGRMCVSLDYSCRMWTTAKTSEWRQRWHADIEAKKALLREMLGGATHADS
jgi:hypothetical protein